jgi:alpha-amylase
VFCIHNHQPVGNFDSVIESGYRDGYLPFVRVLEKHPGIRIVLHVSGALLEWMEREHPEYLDSIRKLVVRGQLELLTGGFYEPVFPAIPDEDKIGQTRKLSSFLREKLGFEPRGMWLPERVWEPSLASAIARAGVEYTVVDDSHFKSSGLTENELLGFYLTEDQGEVIKVFSGSKRLRYLIPFADPEETIEYLRENASAEPGNLLVFADDGEKFGIWPGTGKRCYDDGWLEKFFKILEENGEWLRLVTFSDYISRHRPLGWAFLPTASYAEMMEWCLPAAAQLTYKELVKSLDGRGELDRYGSFVKGGFWRNFFSRYPESNWMYKRMLLARRRVSSAVSSGASGQSVPAALDEVWRAQCNCAYWHGVFGGLYLPHLREAVYRHIIRAERMVSEASTEAHERSTVERIDIDGDGEDEIILTSKEMSCCVSPLRGGTLCEVDHRGLEINLVNTLARRREAYHEQLKTKRNPGESSAEVVSIHDAVTSKEDGLEGLLFYDRLARVCFLDHVLPPETSLNQMQQCEYEELGSFVEAAYSETERTSAAQVLLSCSGQVRLERGQVGLTIEKGFRLSQGEASLFVEYALSFDSGISSELLFAPELNLLFPSGGGLSGTVSGPGSEQKAFELAKATEFQGVGELRVRDHHFGFDTIVSTTNATRLWHFPVETISLSEGGLERIYQGTCITPAWKLHSGSTQGRFSILIELKNIRRTQSAKAAGSEQGK